MARVLKKTVKSAKSGIGFAGVAGLGLFNRRKAQRYIEA